MFGATAATAVSITIAMYAGWHRGGSVVERIMSIAMGCVAVAYVHLLPMGRRLLNGPVRLLGFALWCIGMIVVLYGQITFVLIARQHAGDQRAAMIPTTAPLSRREMLHERTLTEIERDGAKAKVDLARVEARSCVGDCQRLKIRRTILATQITTLETEAGEVRRHEAEEDRRRELADREAALRMAARADPVARQVAPWFGTTEGRLELLLAVACSVVLEGAAITGWMLVPVVSSRGRGCDVVVFNRNEQPPEQMAVASESEFATSGRERPVADRERVSTDSGMIADEDVTVGECSDDDLHLLQEIHKAVVAGHLRPTQAAIRQYLRCGQPRAGYLNRQYVARFDNVRTADGSVMNSAVVRCGDGPPGRVMIETALTGRQNKRGNRADS
ncbi:hypothetical protein [Burkholderia anthina]|uniref:hypothetical protein n=1 Tax=Burkholderia anthina TaxID=179879 RepID=UPI00158BF291|nr:hypothetical protein [Burkholderia anthina]